MMLLRNSRVSWMLVLSVMVLMWSGLVNASGLDGTLIEAVKKADLSSINELLEQGVDVNSSGPDGTTALHWAAHDGNIEVLTRLIQAGGNVAALNRYGITPIWLAAQNGHADIVETFLRLGADSNTMRNDSGETVLMIAARAGHADVLQRLIAYGADVNVADSFRSQTALMWAAAEGHQLATQILSEAGSDLEASSITGLTALMFAIRSGDINVTREMLDQGASLHTTAPDGTTMLVLAIINAHWELAEFLLTKGADPNVDDPVHGRPLHVLAWMRRAENRGLSAWLPRISSGNIDSIELAEALVAHGAEVNDALGWENPTQSPKHMALSMFPGTGYSGATPFFIASKNCDMELMKFLIKHGADPTIQTNQQVSPLLAAAGVGYAIGESPGTPEEALEAVQLLQELGNDVEAIAGSLVPRTGASSGGIGSWDGASALQGAVIRGAEGLVRWLIEQGVSLDHKMKSDETALDLAEGSSLGITYHVQPELAQIIREAMIEQGLSAPQSSERKHSDETKY